MKASVLEKVLLSQVERELEEFGHELADPDEALGHIRAVLKRDGLTAAERIKLAEGPQALLSARIEEALSSTVEALIGAADYRPPNVVVVPGSADSEGVRDTLVESLRRVDFDDSSGTLQIDDADAVDTLVMGAEDEAPRGTLVIADERQMRNLRGDTGAEGEGTLQLPSLTEHPELDGQNLELVGAPGLAEDFEKFERTLRVDGDVELRPAPRPATAPKPASAHRSSGSSRRRAFDALPAFRSPQELVGTIFGGQYEIRRVIGEGGFGAVLEAFDQELLTSVAIKIVRPDAVRSRRDLDEFKEEARRVTRLKHPNIVEWKTLSETEDGTPYFVMEYLDGEELEETLKREGPMSWQRVQNILLQVVGALRAAHHLDGGGSILHLDLKPKNIFLTRNAQGEDVAKVIDFGIGQFASRHTPEAEPEPGGTLSVDALLREAGADPRKSSTRGGVTRSSGCTPEYASPEQSGHMMPGVDIVPLDGRSDLYSVGVVAFQMLTGSLPFEAPRSGKRREYLRLHRDAEPRKLSTMGVKVPRGLARFIEQCLVKDRDKRWPDTQSAYQALERVVQPPISAPVVALLASLALALCLVVWLLVQNPAKEALAANWLDAAGAERNLSETIFLGPEREEVSVRVKAGLNLQQAEILRVVQTQDSSDADPNWGVEATDRGEVRLFRKEGSRARGGRVFLEASDGDTLFSTDQIHLEYISPDAYRIQPMVDMAGTAEVIDPRGMDVKISIHEGPVAAIDRVQLLVGERELPASLQHRGQRDATYLVELGRLSGSYDEVGEMVVRMVDLAGLVHESEPLEQPFDGRSFEPEVELKGVHFSGSSFVLGRTQPPRLEVNTDRRVEVRWTLRRKGEDDLTGLRILDAGTSEMPLGLPRDAERGWTGELTVEVEDQVHHKDRDDGRISLPFTLEYSTRELAVNYLVLEGQRIETLETAATLYLAKRDVTLDFHRNGVAMWAQAEFYRGDEKIGATDRVDRIEPGSLNLPLAFQDDGPVELKLRYGALDVASLQTLPPTYERRLRLIVDTHTPTWVQRPERLFDTKEQPWEVNVEVEDGERPSPLTLTWEFERKSPQKFVPSEEPLVVDPGVLRLPIDRVWGDRMDGEWSLTLRGEDEAGNVLAPHTFPITVARGGPRIDVAVPGTRAGAVWQQYSEDEGHIVELVLTDENGVEAAHARYEVLRDGEVIEDGLMALERRDETIDRWRTRMPFDESVSECLVRLRLSATDSYGNTSVAEPLELRLDEIEPRRPEAILVQAAEGSQPSRMVLVSGDPGRSHVIGGRSIDEERLEAVELGGNMANVEIPLGDLVDYYIQESEVTVGEFLEFVQKAYLLAEFWPPHAQGPDAQTRTGWLKTLQALDPKLPVTKVTWDEARAYASWRGLRLQSYSEWEYAVRGPAYRLTSIPDPQRAEVCISGRADGEPWPVNQGDDVIAEAGGLRNLCSNVAEWTSTPYRLPSFSTPLGPADFPARDPELSAQEWEDLSKMRLVGGSFRASNWSFARRDWGRRQNGLPDVGFRCAISRTELLKAAKEGRLSFSESP